MKGMQLLEYLLQEHCFLKSLAKFRFYVIIHHYSVTVESLFKACQIKTLLHSIFCFFLSLPKPCIICNIF